MLQRPMPNPLRPMHLRAIASAVALAGATTFPVGAHADNAAEALELPSVQVVGTTPLPGLGVPLRDVPVNVQIDPVADQFRAVSAPRSLTLGLRYRFDAPRPRG